MQYLCKAAASAPGTRRGIRYLNSSNHFMCLTAQSVSPQGYDVIGDNRKLNVNPATRISINLKA
jgi:hypothetical protein